MSTVSEYMTEDHKHCDSLFVEASDLVLAKKWEEAEKKFSDFSGALEKHFRREEEVMFPIFEEVTGIVGGPTEVMRIEHKQMLDSLPDVMNSVKNKNFDDYSGYSETLHILTQQHNMKEEQILYSMVDQHLQQQKEELLEKMQAI